MKSTTAVSIALAAASQLVGTLAHSPSKVLRSEGGGPQQSPSKVPVLGETTSQGCFSSSGNLKPADTESSMISSGSCQKACSEGDYTVFALSSTHCYCGNAYPPKDSVVDDDKCNFPCPGYPLEACGGIRDGGYLSVYNSGIKLDVPFYDGKDSSSSTGTDGPTATGGAPTTTATTAVTTPAPGSNSTTTEQSPSGTGQSSATTTPNAAGPMATQMPVLAVVAALVGGAAMF